MFTTKKLHLSQHLVDYQVYQYTCPFHGFGKDLKKNSGVSINTFIMTRRKKDFWFYFNMSEWQKIGGKYLKIVEKNPKKLLGIIERIIEYAANLYNFVKTIPKEEKLRKLSDKQLYKIYKKFHKWHHAFWSLAMTPNLLEAENTYLSDFVLGLAERKKNERQLGRPAFEIFNTIIFSRERSFLERKNEDYLKLLTNLSQNRNKKKLIDVFYNKYCWLEYNWVGPALDRKNLIEQINNDLKKAVDYGDELEKLEKTRINNFKIKKKLLGKMKLNDKEKTLILALERLLYSKGFRMDCSYFSYFQMKKVFLEIARRLGLSLNQVYSVSPCGNEMDDYLIKKKIDANKLNSVYNESALIWNGKESKIFSGKKAKKVIESITEENFTKSKKIKQFKGQVAFQGKVSGTVKVVNHRSEMKKFKVGDILVAGHTDPSLMPVIVKAAAIITDFGGLTCHAAIVSRELKIPCVVGTKIATKVLKDGQLVEVDATKGIVRKIK